MMGFDDWFKNIEKDYPRYQNKDGYNIGNTPSLKAGWKAALNWVLKECTDYGSDGLGSYCMLDDEKVEEELKEE